MCKTFTDIDNFVDNMLYGKIIEVAGANNSYKTSCALSISRSVLNNDPDAIVVYIDSDSHMRQKYLEDYSIDLNRFVIMNTSDPNEILNILIQVVSDNISNIIFIIDTISNLKVNSAYRELKSFLVKLTKIIYNHNIVVIAINQYRYDSRKKQYVSFCESCFDAYASMRLCIINKQDDSLILHIAKNKLTGQFDCPVIIYIGKTSANQ